MNSLWDGPDKELAEKASAAYADFATKAADRYQGYRAVPWTSLGPQARLEWLLRARLGRLFPYGLPW